MFGEMLLAVATVYPSGDRAAVFEEMVDEMTAGEARSARDQRGTRHGR